MSMAAARLLLAVFSKGTGREDPFHSVVISPDITDKDQMADCHLWGQFPSSSVLSVIYPQFSASHWSLPCFPYTFWFCFCLIVILTKTSFHPAFSSTPQFHFSSSHLSQVEEKHQCDTVKLNLLSSPSKGQAAQGRGHIQGTHMRIIWDLHHAVSWHSQSWRNMKLLCLICLFVGQWAAPQCQHVVVPPGVIYFHEMLNIFRAMPPPNLCHSVLVRDFWLDVNIGHQQISLWYHLPSSFRHCSPVAFWSTAHSKAHLTYIIYLYYPINHSSWCSVTQPLIKAKSWFSCNIIIYKQIYK